MRTVWKVNTVDSVEALEKRLNELSGQGWETMFLTVHEQVFVVVSKVSQFREAPVTPREP